MKICKRLLCGSLALAGFLFSNPVEAQTLGDGYFQPAGVQPMMADVNLAWPGRVWVQGSFADRGLGYTGSYVTLGAKSHLAQDFLDGRWMVEARGHFNPESSGFFGNIGLERAFTLEAAGADISAGIWYDHDQDLQGDFAHPMDQFAVNASIKTRKSALIANAYFPVGTTDYAQGDPTGVNCFLNHSIVVQPGIDSALKGFDALWQFRPQSMAHVNGSFGIGGYGYSSELINSFGGVRARLGFQFEQGMIVTAEMNHDNRFDLTGVLQVGWLFGAGARGTEYGFLGTDLEPTIRNDHIVRVQQDLMLAIDPDTGLPYNVYHVDNLADAAFADGTAETPFTTLAAAEAASSTDDIIFVREGNGTVAGMSDGIVLKDGQMLLGDGVQHLIPLAGGTNFILCNDVDGIRPRITNTAGDAVTLADRNTVRGIIIDGSSGGMINGIAGNGTLVNPITNGIIEDVQITGGPVLNGIFLNNIAGDWTFARNDIQTAAFDGIFINNALDPTSVFDFEANLVSNNGADGINMQNYDGTSFRFLNNTTNNNVGSGVRLETFVNSAGMGSPLDIINPTSIGNQDDGITLAGYSGDVRILNSNIQNNINNGISLIDVVSPNPGDMVFIGTSGGGVSNILGNGVGTGAGVFNQFGVAGARQDLFITNSTIDNGGTGVSSSVTAVGASLTTQIVDNLSISGNQSDGIRLSASGGSLHNATVTNTAAAAGPLQIANNQGNGISQFASGTGIASLLQTNVNNVNITGSGDNGMLFNSIEDGQLIANTTNSTIAGAGSDGVEINADNDNSLGVNEVRFDNLTMNGIADDGFDINVFQETFLDFSLSNSVLNNGLAGNQGMEITVIGDDTLPTVDTRFRMHVVGSTITGFDSGNGIGITTLGDAHMFAQIEGTSITNNGFNQVATGTPAIPFGDGVSIAAGGESELALRLVNNQITGNGEQGVDIDTTGDAQVNALLQGNFLAGNDTQDDATTVPIESGNADMTATNLAGGADQICIAMSTNFFTLPVVFTNTAGIGQFEVELDGLTNGLGVPIFNPGIGAFTISPFGSTCAPAINAEDAAFQGNGFTPLP